MEEETEKIFHFDCADLPSGDLFVKATSKQKAFSYFMWYIEKSLFAGIEEADKETAEGYDLKEGEVIEEH